MNNNIKKIRYKFVNEESDNDSMDDMFSFYYQICTFPDPHSKKFHMRKFIINGKNEFVDVLDFKLSNKQCKKFFAIKKKHEYKCYPMHNLNNVDYPNMGDILMSKSDILGNDYDYSGFAPFN